VARARANRVKEEKAAYGAPAGNVVVMEGADLERAELYVLNLRAKAVRVSHALTAAGIPHAVVGGLAVLAHVFRVNPSAIRSTRDLDILLARADLERATPVLKSLGFTYRKVMGIPAFLPPREAVETKRRFQEGVHVVWANERVRPADPVPAPVAAPQSVVVAPDGYTCLDVENLLRMKLTSFRLKDQVHIQDMLAVGLITASVRRAVPPELRARLKQVEEITERERLG